MIAGVSWAWWVGFHAVVAAVLVADWFCPASGANRGTRRHLPGWEPRVWCWPRRLLPAGSPGAGRQPALEYVAGYTIETSLSIDNLFVFMVLFQGFRIGAQRQHKALMWGVWGAFVLRAVFIASGISLLRRFEWVT